MGKIGPFVGLDYEISPFVGIGPVVGIGLFWGTGPVVTLTYIFQVLFVLCSSRLRYQVSVHRTIGPLVMPPTLKKWGTYWFRLVPMYVCMYVFMFEISS